MTMTTNGSATRQAIIETAKKMLYTRSFEEISMVDVANAREITAPTLYHYFQGKKELLTAAGNQIEEDILNRISIKFPRSMLAKLKLLTVISMIVAYFVETKLPAAGLMEDSVDRPVSFLRVRQRVLTLIKELPGIKNADEDLCTLLGVIAGYVIYLKAHGKDPEGCETLIYNLVFK